MSFAFDGGDRGMLVDISNAFETIDHDILLFFKLERCDITRVALHG